jgi:integrase
LNLKTCPKCGTLFTRDNRKYRVSVSIKGQRVNRILDNLTLARETEASIKGDMIRGEYDIASHKTNKTPTMNQVWEKYLLWAKEHKKSWRDDEYYYRKHIEPRFGTRQLDNVKGFDIEKMKLDLKKDMNARGKPYAAQTIKHQICILRRLYNLAKKWGLYDGGNPVDTVQMPKVNNRRTECLSDEELGRLIETLDAWPCVDSAAFVKFALYTGLRRGELFRLEWDHIDFERGWITLKNPKGGIDQTLPISDQALDVIRVLSVESKYVFPGKAGGMRTDFKGPWDRIRKAADLPEDFRLHGLRHNFASHLVSNGVDLAVVKELLTHKDMSTTQRYAHLRPDAVKDAARRAGELLSPKRRADVLTINERG